jgi:hypothetical protein
VCFYMRLGPNRAKSCVFICVWGLNEQSISVNIELCCGVVTGLVIHLYSVFGLVRTSDR